MDASHREPYHPESQGAAERSVAKIKNHLLKTGISRGQKLQDIVSSINFCPSSTPGTGSPAMRLLGRNIRGPLPAPPSQLPPQQPQALKIQHQRMKDKTLKCRNARTDDFAPGQEVLLYQPKAKRYSLPAIIDSPIISDDGFPRSYKVIMEDGLLRHYQAHWIISMPPADATQ